MFNIVYTSIIIRSQKGKYEQNTTVSNSRQVKRVNSRSGSVCGAAIATRVSGKQCNEDKMQNTDLQKNTENMKYNQLSFPLILTRTQVYNTTPSCENNTQR